MALQNQRRFSVRIAGVDYKVWDSKTGGAVDSAEKKYNPGGMEDAISEGGKQILENLTTTRYFDPAQHQVVLKTLRRLAGKGAKAPFVGIEQFLDADKNVVGEGDTYYGTLKRVASPEHDSESDDEAMIEIEATITKIV